MALGITIIKYFEKKWSETPQSTRERKLVPYNEKI
jgi:hypothetical protein